MKRLLRLGLFLVLGSVPLLAAKNSQTFLLPTEVRVGDSKLPEGHCTVIWTAASGLQVQLTIKTEDKKTITIPARVIEGRQVSDSVETAASNGVTYLLCFHTANATFVVQDTPKISNEAHATFPVIECSRGGPYDTCENRAPQHLTT